jgi:hypothetical protein
MVDANNKASSLIIALSKALLPVLTTGGIKGLYSLFAAPDTISVSSALISIGSTPKSYDIVISSAILFDHFFCGSGCYFSHFYYFLFIVLRSFYHFFMLNF